MLLVAILEIGRRPELGIEANYFLEMLRFAI